MSPFVGIPSGLHPLATRTRTTRATEIEPLASGGTVEHGADSVAAALVNLFARTCKVGCAVDRGYSVNGVSDMCAVFT